MAAEHVEIAPEAIAQRRRAYNAFISYSRAADGKLAPAMQRGLQRFAKPWYRLRALRIFRDDASLAANPDLWGSIQQALDDSEFFILLASPESAASQWVAKEAQYWLEQRGTERLLVVLTDGELVWEPGLGVDMTRTTALPAPLGGAFAEEPRYVDLRWARSRQQLAQRDARFRAVLADLAAPLHGRSKDDLFGEDVRQHRRTLAISWSAGALLALLAVGASLLAVLAVKARDRAQTQSHIALSRQLAAQSVTQLDGPAELSPLLGLEALRLVRNQPDARSFDARNALLLALQRSPRLLATLPQTQVREVAFSPDGRTLVSGASDGSVRFWNARDGSPLGPPRAGRRSGVRAIGFSPDGGTIAVGDDGGTVTFWDARHRRPLGDPVHGPRFVQEVVFSPDGATLAAVGPDRVRLWDARHRRRKPRLLGAEYGVMHAAFTGDGRALVSTDLTGDATLWQLDRAGAAHTIGGDVLGLGTSADGKRLLAAEGDAKTVQLADAVDGRPVGPPLPHGDGVFSVAFTPGGKTLAFGGSGTTVELWHRDGKKPTGETLLANQGAYATVVLNRAGTVLASVGADGTVRLWDAREDQPLGRTLRLGERQTGAVSSIAASADGRMVATGTDQALTFWDAGRGEAIGAPHPVLWGVTSLAFSPDGRTLVVADRRAALTFWDTRRHRPLAPPRYGRQKSVWSLAYTPDGKQISAGSPAGSVELWDAVRRQPLRQTRFAMPPTCPGSDPTGKYTSCPQDPQSVAAGPDSSTLVFGSGDGLVRLWDPVQRQSLGELRPDNSHFPVEVASTTDGRTLATGSANSVGLWDVVRRQPLGRQLSVPNSVGSVAFSGDGRTLVSGGSDGTVRVWDRILLSTSFEAWRARLCRMAGRNLTRSEWARFLEGQPYRRTCPEFAP